MPSGYVSSRGPHHAHNYNPQEQSRKHDPILPLSSSVSASKTPVSNRNMNTRHNTSLRAQSMSFSMPSRPNTTAPSVQEVRGNLGELIRSPNGYQIDMRCTRWSAIEPVPSGLFPASGGNIEGNGLESHGPAIRYLLEQLGLIASAFLQMSGRRSLDS